MSFQSLMRGGRRSFDARAFHHCGPPTERLAQETAEAALDQLRQ